MVYCYRVRTICAARIRETWTVRSPVPLTPAELQARAVDGFKSTRGVRCHEDDTDVHEDDRTVVTVVGYAEE